jgi:hypothetical protein
LEKLFATRPEICINPTEHKKFVWKTPQQALHDHNNGNEPLIPELDECIRLYYN